MLIFQLRCSPGLTQLQVWGQGKTEPRAHSTFSGRDDTTSLSVSSKGGGARDPTKTHWKYGPEIWRESATVTACVFTALLVFLVCKLQRERALVGETEAPAPHLPPGGLSRPAPGRAAWAPPAPVPQPQGTHTHRDPHPQGPTPGTHTCSLSGAGRKTPAAFGDSPDSPGQVPLPPPRPALHGGWS